MLSVPGVGEAKYKKYGEKFISEVVHFLGDNPDAVTCIVDESQDDRAESKKRKSKKKQEFYILEEDAENFNYGELYLVTEIRDELNRITSVPDVKHLPATRISEVLMSKGLIEEQVIDGYSRKIQTELGLQKGITTVERIAKSGVPYTTLAYPPEVQREVVTYYIGPRDTI